MKEEALQKFLVTPFLIIPFHCLLSSYHLCLSFHFMHYFLSKSRDVTATKEGMSGWVRDGDGIAFFLLFFFVHQLIIDDVNDKEERSERKERKGE